jgi:hypothetical protein
VSESSLHAIAHDGVAEGLRDDEPDPCAGVRGVLTGLDQVHHDQLPAGAATVPNRSGEPCGVGEALLSGQHWGARPVSPAGSGSQAIAALAAARRQHGATGAGPHPEAEAVRLVTTPVVRLERTLAHEFSTQFRGRLGVSGQDVDDRVGVVAPSWLPDRQGSIDRVQLVPLTHDRLLETGHGHAAPVDIGSTAQRYVVGSSRVKRTTCGCGGPKKG